MKFSGRAQQHSCKSCAIVLLALCALSFPAWTQPTAPNSYYVHSAVAGDTLVHLAARYLIKPNDWQSLQKVNKIADPYRIRPGTAIRIPIADMNTELAPAKVVSVGGPVEAGSTKLAVGSAVVEGQNIKTGDNGFVTLKLADGSVLVVNSKSKMRLDAARTITNTNGIPVTRVMLESGRVEAQVEKQKRAGPGRFEIRTPTSNMGVRGTKFRVSSDDDGKTARGEVLEGLVNVAGSDANAAIDVGAGFGTVVAQSQPPLQAVKLAAAPDLSSTSKLQERPVLRFQFADQPDARGYRAQVASDIAFADLRAEAIFKSAEAKFADLADGQYFLRVRAIDSLGIEGSDTVLPFRLKARPEPPFTSAPQNNGKFSGNQAAFSWSSASEAASYRFQLSRDVAFMAPLVDEKSYKGASYAPATTLAPGNYFWRVASIRADGDAGPFSDVQSFLLKPVPAAPNPPKEDGNRVSFSWGAEPGQKFDFQLARDSGFKDLVTEQKTDKPEISIDKPGDAGTYFMRYRATDPDGFVAPYSSAQSFEVKRSYWWLLLLLPLVF